MTVFLGHALCNVTLKAFDYLGFDYKFDTQSAVPGRDCPYLDICIINSIP